MNCEKIQNLLNDYIDETLSVLHAEMVINHCHTCERCARQLEGLRIQKASLISLPVPPASDGFEKRVVATAIQDAQAKQNMHNKQGSFYKFATAAMISALVLWLGLFNDTKTGKDDLYLVSVGDEVRTIKVAIDSEQALDAVNMRVELSDNLELKGFGNKKQISWTTHLREGVNLISLPIVGLAQGEGDITTRIQLNGKEKVMHIKTEYKLPDSVLYEGNRVLQG
ncbi:MAG: anti-sigma factor family protein [Gammaproteobacteria bacterium]